MFDIRTTYQLMGGWQTAANDVQHSPTSATLFQNFAGNSFRIQGSADSKKKASKDETNIANGVEMYTFSITPIRLIMCTFLLAAC